MHYTKLMAVVTAAVGLAACGQEEKPLASDLAFLDSLHLATVLEADSARQTVSALELGLAQGDSAAPVEEEVEEPAAAAPRRSSSSSSASSSSSDAGTYSGGSVAPAPQPRTVTVKHTKRDAAIGAGAGAVIGAVAGGRNNRVKGALIGAVVGGVAGAVIGNNVDKETRVVY